MAPVLPCPLAGGSVSGENVFETQENNTVCHLRLTVFGSFSRSEPWCSDAQETMNFAVHASYEGKELGC